MKNLKLVAFAAAFSMANVALAQDKAVSAAPKPQTDVVATDASQTKEEAIKERADYNERATKQTARISEICGLNDEQKIKVYQIYLDSYPQIKAAKKAAGNDATKAKEEATKIEKERRAKVEATLTPDQKFRLDNEVRMNNGKAIDAVEPAK